MNDKYVYDVIFFVYGKGHVFEARFPSSDFNEDSLAYPKDDHTNFKLFLLDILQDFVNDNKYTPCVSAYYVYLPKGTNNARVCDWPHYDANFLLSVHKGKKYKPTNKAKIKAKGDK